jgi:YD repeat-containing protein
LIIDSVGNKTTYAYDVNDRRIGETNATGKAIVYQYDLAHDGQGLHRGSTYEKINEELGQATSKSDAERILQDLAARIQAGTFP